MNRNFKNYLTQIIAIVLLIFIFSDVSAKKKPKLAGEWKINMEESNTSYQMSMAPSSIIITQQKKEIHIVRKFNIMGQDATMDEVLTIGGEESEYQGPMNTTIKSDAVWSDEGKSLIVNSKIQSSYGEFSTKLEYSVEKDKLKVVSVFSTAEGDINETWILDRDK